MGLLNFFRERQVKKRRQAAEALADKIFQHFDGKEGYGKRPKIRAKIRDYHWSMEVEIREKEDTGYYRTICRIRLPYREVDGKMEESSLTWSSSVQTQTWPTNDLTELYRMVEEKI
jgi:hypothetical protein